MGCNGSKAAAPKQEVEDVQPRMLGREGGAEAKAAAEFRVRLGQALPDFECETTEGRLRFHEYLGREGLPAWTVLFSHPKNFTPVSATELAAISGLVGRLGELGVKLIGLSCDPLSSHAEWAKDVLALKQGAPPEDTAAPGAGEQGAALGFPMIADEKREIAALLGVLDQSEKDSAGGALPARALFVIGPDRTNRATVLYPASTGRSFVEVLRLVESLMLTRDVRLATPGNWQAKDRVIVAPAVTSEEAKAKFAGFDQKALPSGKEYLRYVDCPSEPAAPAQQEAAPTKQEEAAPAQQDAAKEGEATPATQEPAAPGTEEAVAVPAPQEAAAEQQGTPAPATQEVPAQQESAAPAQQEVAAPAKQESAAPAQQESAAPAQQEEAAPTKEEAAAPAQQEAAPAQKEAAAAQDATAPAPPAAPAPDFAIRIGAALPDFACRTTEGDFTFHEFLAREPSWTILFSHPGDFTPVCTTELALCQAMAPQFRQQGVKLIGLSCSSVDEHREWAKDVLALSRSEEERLAFPLIADEGREIVARLGMLDPSERDAAGLPMPARALFVIGPDGTNRATILYPATTGRDFEEVLRVVASLRLAEDTGLATPADWQRGDRAIVAPAVTTEEARERFSNLEVRELPSAKPYLRFVDCPASAQQAAEKLQACTEERPVEDKVVVSEVPMRTACCC